MHRPRFTYILHLDSLALDHLIAWKDEEMLVREFDREHPEYRRRAPIFILA